MHIKDQYHYFKQSRKSGVPYQKIIKAFSGGGCVSCYENGDEVTDIKDMNLSQLNEYKTSLEQQRDFDPSFSNFMLNEIYKNIGQGTDFYIQSPLKTDQQVKDWLADPANPRNHSGQSRYDIVTEEKIAANPEEYIDPSSANVSTRISGLGMTAYKVVDDRELENRRGLDLAMPGCGDNMTCMTSATFQTLDALDAWNKAIKDPNSPYYGAPALDASGAISTSHPKFWNPNSREYLARNPNIQDQTFTMDSFYKEDASGIKRPNPTAVADFYRTLKPGSIMGIHGAGHRDDTSLTPGHAVIYTGKVRYNDQELDFTTPEGYQKALELFESDDDFDLYRLKYDFFEDSTSNDPYGISTETFGDMFYGNVDNPQNVLKVATYNTSGVEGYDDWIESQLTNKPTQEYIDSVDAQIKYVEEQMAERDRLLSAPSDKTNVVKNVIIPEIVVDSEDQDGYKRGGLTKGPIKSTLTAAKAKRILEHGSIKGKKLTEKQKKYFKYVAGGGKTNQSLFKNMLHGGLV